MNFFQKISEKLYYKAFPDRIKDHETANAPIMPDFHVYETIAQTNYKPVILKVAEIVPREMIARMDQVEYKKFNEFSRKELCRKIAPEIEKRMVIRQIYNEKTQTYMIEATFKFWEEA